MQRSLWIAAAGLSVAMMSAVQAGDHGISFGLPAFGHSSGSLSSRNSTSGGFPRMGQSSHSETKKSLPKLDVKNSLPRTAVQPSKLEQAKSKQKMPALNIDDLMKSQVHVAKPFDMQQVTSLAPKSLSSQSHFPWWVIVLNSHHCNHNGNWNYQTYCWDNWRPCTYTTVVCRERSYYVGLTCVFIPDMQAYGVQSVAFNSPASIAGVKSGDLILSINRHAVSDENVLQEEMSRGRLDLQLARDGEAEGISATVVPKLLTTLSY